MSEMAPALAVIGLLFAIFAASPTRPAWSRIAVSSIVLFLLLRYVGWRIHTLPSLADSDSAWKLFCFGLEMLLTIDAFVLFLLLSRRVNRSAAADDFEERLRRLPAALFPAVDVLIPTYNEGLDTLERTIVGALGIDYPNLTVWVLDDGKRDWLRDYCSKKGAMYIRREYNEHAKAGNINNALALTSGEFIAVFDADFVPHRNFIFRTWGFFEDSSIGCVQTPQHFFNKDPIQLNLGLDRVWPDDQRFFFHTIMPSRDAWGAAFCCGSSMLIRRAAIESVGGFPTQSVTEDMLASLAMLRRGYRTIYLDEQLSLGLAPESIEGFFVQRKRWCRGNIQILFLRSGPFGPGLPLLIRLFTLPTYYLLQPAQILFLVIPVIYFWHGLSPLPSVSTAALLYYQLPCVVGSFMALLWFSRLSWMPILSTASTLFQAIRLTPTVLVSYIRPFGVPFKVTPKGRLNDRVVVDANTAMIAVTLLILTVGGLAVNTQFQYRNVGNEAFFRLGAIWAIWNSLALFLLLLTTIERPRRRGEERFPLRERGTCSLRDVVLGCEMVDISATGAKLKFDAQHAVYQGTEMTLGLENVGQLSGRIVWSAAGQAGLRFGRLSADTNARLAAQITKLSLAVPERLGRAQRIELKLRAICEADEIESECLIENASITGLLVSMEGARPKLGASITVEMPGVGRFTGSVVRQVSKERFGFKFDELSESVRDRLIQHLYSEGVGYSAHHVRGGPLFRALWARAFG